MTCSSPLDSGYEQTPARLFAGGRTRPAPAIRERTIGGSTPLDHPAGWKGRRGSSARACPSLWLPGLFLGRRALLFLGAAAATFTVWPCPVRNVFWYRARGGVRWRRRSTAAAAAVPGCVAAPLILAWAFVRYGGMPGWRTLTHAGAAGAPPQRLHQYRRRRPLPPRAALRSPAQAALRAAALLHRRAAQARARGSTTRGSPMPWPSGSRS